MRVVAIIGEPGVGKSTLMAELLPMDDTSVETIVHKNPVPHTEYLHLKSPTGTVAQLGIPFGPFPGTDRLSYTVVGPAEQWILSQPFDWVFFEGDRLAIDRFLTACKMAGKLEVFFLKGIDAARDRRLARSHAVGKAQNEEWVGGRRTKVHNVVERWREHVTFLDATKTPTDLAEEVRRTLDAREA